MVDWGSWEFSKGNEKLLSDLSAEFKTAPGSLTCRLWWNMLNFGETGDECSPMDVDAAMAEPNRNDVEKVVRVIKDCLKTESRLEEKTFVGIPFNSFYKIFECVRNDLDDFSFGTFCEYISSWNSDLLIEQALKGIVLNKLQGCEESSACTIHSLTELAKNKPSQLCHNVLIPLLTDETEEYKDAELLSHIYPVLPDSEKDLLVMALTQREKMLDTTWLLFQPMVKYLSPYTVTTVIECIHKWSGQFTKSQMFGRFLVSFCRCMDLLSDRETLVGAIEKHETLFKRQALKFLNQ